jgi:hypothetical protein
MKPQSEVQGSGRRRGPKIAIVKTVAALPSDMHLIATVHDELIFDSALN